MGKLLWTNLEYGRYTFQRFFLPWYENAGRYLTAVESEEKKIKLATFHDKEVFFFNLRVYKCLRKAAAEMALKMYTWNKRVAWSSSFLGVYYAGKRRK